MSDVPSSFNKVQQEAIQYNNPVSEASLSSLAAPINGLLSVVLPIGSTVYSMLTEVQFQAQLGNPSPVTWILADGRSVVGSAYANLVGPNVPDLRGIFQRAKNNGRADGNQNPDGDLALGTYTADKVGPHTHPITDPGHAHSTSARDISSGGQSIIEGSGSDSLPTGIVAPNVTGISVNNNSGNETAPKNVTLNAMIRIN